MKNVRLIIWFKIFLFKTVLYSERIKSTRLKKQSKCYCRCSVLRRTSKMFQEWLLLAPFLFPITPHIYEVLGSVMLASCSTTWQGSESLSPGCQFFFSFAAMLIKGSVWSSYQCENSVAGPAKLFLWKEGGILFFRHVFPACSKGLLSQDAKLPQKGAERRRDTEWNRVWFSWGHFSLGKRRIRDDKHLLGW